MTYDYIRQGDCLELMKEIPDGSVDLVITDPPYWHHKSPGKAYSERKQCSTKSKFSNSDLYNAEGAMMNGMSDFDKSAIANFLNAVCPKLKTMNVYTFCSESQVPYYCLWADENGYMFSILCWEKPLSIINKNRYSQNLEYIVRIYDYGTALNRLENNELYNRVRRDKPVTGQNKAHPVEKPTSLCSAFIALSSQVGDIILDPFVGSGTTCVADIREKRHYIGFELDPKYFEIAQQRIAQEHQQLTLF